jgi:hypothetical protein
VGSIGMMVDEPQPLLLLHLWTAPTLPARIPARGTPEQVLSFEFLETTETMERFAASGVPSSVSALTRRKTDRRLMFYGRQNMLLKNTRLSRRRSIHSDRGLLSASGDIYRAGGTGTYG